MLLYVPSQQLWSLRDGQFTLPHFFLGKLKHAVNQYFVHILSLVTDNNPYDTSLYIIVENPIQAATILNYDLSQIYTWASNWLVTFNPSKTESLLFSRKLFKPLHPTLYINQQDIITVESHKHLGLTFTNDLSWHEHLNNIKTKAWHRINVMRNLKFQLIRKSLKIIYFSFIRPLLEYADAVWDNCTQYEANELEKIQNEAARIVSGATKLVSIDKLLKEVGWGTLSCRRKKNINKYYSTK